MKKIRFISIYLPQFHAIPENDMAWGKGFTEWTNVKKAKPLFWGHYQPHIPHNSIGYYDLGDPETMIKQAELARSFGIHGFAFYHYWFNGKRLLNIPVDNMLKTGKPDFPFYLFWANVTWSRSWLGQEKDFIIKQTYTKEDNLNHIRWLIQVFSDPRYIRINNRPVFTIYRPNDIPDLDRFIQTFKNECTIHGEKEPYLIASNSHTWEDDLLKKGFDAMLCFEPQLGLLPNYSSDKLLVSKFRNNLKLDILSCKLKVYDYTRVKEIMLNRCLPYPYYPCLFVNWDNSPRRGRNSIIINNSTPQLFEKYLRLTIDKFKTMGFSENENLIMINAWNEWAEGNYLEPDLKNGFKYLEALKAVVEQVNRE
jgi:hypothetical protein